MNAAAPPPTTHERLDFANQLRGVAALLVAASHLAGVYWGMRGFVAVSTFSPAQPGPAPFAYWLAGYGWYQSGPLGVALFFLISGLVIPFSLRHHTRASFIAARLLRIYPTFLLATLCEMLLLLAAAHYWHIRFAHGARTIIAECLLVSDMAGTPVIDFVSWTLSVELKFYLLMMIVAPAIRRGSLGALFGIAGAMLALDWLLARHAMPPPLASFVMETPYLIFMLMGVLFHFLLARLCRPLVFAAATAAMAALFVVSWRLSPERAEFPVVTANYLAALMLFGGLCALRRRIPRSRVLDGMAAVSYPFYLVHAVFGFTIMKFLMLVWHLDYYAASVAALVVLLGIAATLHRVIERPSIAWGRRLAVR